MIGPVPPVFSFQKAFAGKRKRLSSRLSRPPRPLQRCSGGCKRHCCWPGVCLPCPPRSGRDNFPMTPHLIDQASFFNAEVDQGPSPPTGGFEPGLGLRSRGENFLRVIKNGGFEVFEVILPPPFSGSSWFQFHQLNMKPVFHSHALKLK